MGVKTEELIENIKELGLTVKEVPGFIEVFTKDEDYQVGAVSVRFGFQMDTCFVGFELLDYKTQEELYNLLSLYSFTRLSHR